MVIALVVAEDLLEARLIDHPMEIHLAVLEVRLETHLVEDLLTAIPLMETLTKDFEDKAFRPNLPFLLGCLKYPRSTQTKLRRPANLKTTSAPVATTLALSKDKNG
jgi:hypothetical protein